MKKTFCFCMAAVLAVCTCGCSSVKKSKVSSSELVVESTAPVNNTARKFIGKWESYKAEIMGESYEEDYAGFPLSAVMKLEILEDNTATISNALNPRGKESNASEYKWNITSDGNTDTLHILSEDERYDCIVDQGQMIVTYGESDSGTQLFLLKTDKFTEPESTTEAGLDKVDFSGFMGKWESEEVTSDGVTYTDMLGEYPVNVSFMLEVKSDNTASMNLFGEEIDYSWEPEKKDQLYMWGDYEGFTMNMEDGKLVINDENGLIVKLHKVDEFTEYDFSAAADAVPDDDIILYPPAPEETT